MILSAARQTAAQLMLLSPPRRRGAWSTGFYDSPPLPELEPLAPGQLIRSEPMDAYLSPGLRLRARAWRVLYRSTGAVGEPTAVSGTVLLPRRVTREPRPLIGFAIGTHGIGDAAAPSRLLSRGIEWEAGLMAMALARGWGLAVSDYQGLGTPGDHAYMVGRALGPNVLDSMRAARHLLPEEFPGEGPAAVIGYSEGGAASAWAAQLQPTYAPELPLRGVVAGAAAADVETAGPSLDGTFFSFFMAYGGIGYAAAYPELELDRYLTPLSRQKISFMRRSTVLQAALFGPHHIHADELTQPNVLEMPAWRARLRENRLGRIAPEAPVLLHHARRDQIVSFVQSVNLREDWQKLGADVRLYVTRGGVDHLSGALAGTPVGLAWLAKRLGRSEDQRPISTVVEEAPLREVA